MIVACGVPTIVVGALASLNREPVGLPVRVDTPKTTANDLKVAQGQVKTALSAPVHLTLGETRWNLRPARIARVLELPADGRPVGERVPLLFPESDPRDARVNATLALYQWPILIGGVGLVFLVGGVAVGGLVSGRSTPVGS